MNKILLAGAVLATCLSAQTPTPNRMGTFDNTGATYTTRGGASAPNINPADLFVRFDKERYAGWTTGAVPGMRDLTGLHFIIQDQDLATQDGYAMVVYGESATQPNFPETATPIATSGNFAGLPLGTGIGAYIVTASFATPVQAPASGDVFCALRFNTAWTVVGGSVTDGLSVHEIRSQLANPQPGQQWDMPGAGRPTVPFDEGTFGGYYVPTQTVGPQYALTFGTMYKITPMLPIAGGVATAVTNQTNHPESTASSTGVEFPGAGTACMMSGLFPDAANPPLNPGRVDDIGQTYVASATNVPVGSLVFFLIDLGTFGAELPVSAFIAGSTGVTCLNLPTMQTRAIAFTTASGTNSIASSVVSFPAATRLLLPGSSWLQQAVGFNSTTMAAHAGPCTRQQM